MDGRCIQLMALLNQISVRGDDVERMCRAKILLREIAAAMQNNTTKPETAEQKGES